MTVDGWLPPPQPLALDTDEVHVWRAALDLPHKQEQALWALLSDDEQERAARFHFERHRRRFIAARGLLRTTLARYLDCPPRPIRFRYGPQGKPALDHQDKAGEVAHIQFNVAHSADLALIAVTRDRRVGVDLEQRRPLSDAVQIAHRFFSPLEVAAVEAATGEQQLALFFQIWSRKEAFIKATGQGLSQPLADFDVVDPAGAPTPFVRLSPIILTPRWRILDLHPHPDFAAAVVAEGDGWQVRRLEIGDQRLVG
ncbi:MAG TPA: 4'-phosphopantetheinyl transferase superfamily protein [Candidatus Sulfomarinibacteraceae bacterium]|nr:4'-phosphopantetheinyl transferase superfamily protein [Candidatus Sulfomarinibacteraceae bacterium]